MSRTTRRAAVTFAAVAVLSSPASPRAQEVLSQEEEQARRLGFYFALSLERTSHLGPANGIGLLVDAPDIGGNFDLSGPEVDGDFGGRFNLGFQLGFRLRNEKGKIEANYFQLDEREDLLTISGPDKAIANTLASPGAGFAEDVGRRGFEGEPDGLVTGFEAGQLSDAMRDMVIDGAEDWNFNGSPDFIRFDTADRIVGTLETDYKAFDLEFVRKAKRMRRFQLDWRGGVRLASLQQDTDLGYRTVGSFAVYSDNEGETGMREGPYDGVSEPIWDGDGDGLATTPSGNEPDGDGFMDGSNESTVRDQLQSVETITEDRILATIDTEGVGLKLGLDGRFELSKKWNLIGGLSLSLLSTDQAWRYREVFTSERDRFLNFIEWDFNGDGRYDNYDLDFDGSCIRDGLRPEECNPTAEDADVLPEDDNGFPFVEVTVRSGISDSVVADPRATNENAFRGENLTRLREGDPVPESERNSDILREVKVLRDARGTETGLTPILDLSVGAEYQFSRFARFDFGLRASRWFGAGRFRTLANDLVAGHDVDLRDGDFTLDGYYLRLTIVPR